MSVDFLLQDAADCPASDLLAGERVRSMEKSLYRTESTGGKDFVLYVYIRDDRYVMLRFDAESLLLEEI